MSIRENEVRDRAQDACELCAATERLELVVPEPVRDGIEWALLACETCRAQLGADSDVDPDHFQYALQGSIWSEVPAVQGVSFRLLHRIDAVWANELLEQAYLADDVREWAEAGIADEPDDTRPPAFDSNGAELADGDAVTLIKDLDVKGANFTAKRGTLVKGIRLTDDPTHIEGKVNGTAIYLKTEFLKKA